jgi:GT2 family glycosyltransferase
MEFLPLFPYGRAHDCVTRSSGTLAVVLNYKGAEDTIRCVHWLSRLVPEQPSIVVVDNGSGDGSVAAIRGAHPSVEILELTVNLGFSCGNNRGIQHAVEQARARDAMFEFVWLVNNDTYGDEHALAALVAAAHRDAKIGAVGPVLISPPPSCRTQSLGTRVLPSLAVTWNNRALRGRVNSLCAASMLIRTAALERTGLLDETFFFCWEDADLSQRLLAAGWKLAVAEDSLVTHKEGASAAAASAFRIFHHVRGIVLFARRHSPLPWFSATFATLICAANCLLLRRRPTLLAAVWSGFVDGWRTRVVPLPALPCKANDFTTAGTRSPPQDS